jgi:hypothetical protein
MSRDYWTELVSLESKDDMHRGIANTLDKNDVTTLLATADFFGASDSELHQMNWDLVFPKFRVFDWLAMGVMSADSNPRIPVTALKVFVHSFLKVGGSVKAFIDDLRVTDYEIDTEWENISFEGGE